MYEARYGMLAFSAKPTNLFSNLHGQGDKVKNSESGVNVFAFQAKTKTIVRRIFWTFLIISFAFNEDTLKTR